MLLEFVSIPEIEKANTLWFDSIFMSSRVENQAVLHLFKMDGFFVEATYNPITETLSGYHPFTNKRLLLPYLDGLI